MVRVKNIEFFTNLSVSASWSLAHSKCVYNGFTYVSSESKYSRTPRVSNFRKFKRRQNLILKLIHPPFRLKPVTVKNHSHFNNRSIRTFRMKHIKPTTCQKYTEKCFYFDCIKSISLLKYCEQTLLIWYIINTALISITKSTLAFSILWFYVKMIFIAFLKYLYCGIKY